MKRPTPLVRTFTENLMAYALGRRVEYFDQPTIRAHRARPRKPNNYKMSSFILGVVKSDAFRMRRVEPEAATTDTTKAQRTIVQETRSDEFHHWQADAPPHVPPGRHGRHGGAAVPRRDGGGEGHRRKAAAAADRTRLICIEEVHGLAGCNKWGATQAPVRAGRDRLELHDRARQRAVVARAVSRAPDDRLEHRRAHGRGVHRARNRRRPLPLERGVPDPVASEADAGLGHLGRHLVRPDVRAALRPGHAAAVDAVLHREPRPGRRLHLQLLVRLHRLDQLGVAERAAADDPRPARRVRHAVRHRRLAGRSRRRAARPAAASSTSSRAKSPTCARSSASATRTASIATSTHVREIERRIQAIEARNTSGEERALPDAPAGRARFVPGAHAPDVRPAGARARDRHDAHHLVQDRPRRAEPRLPGERRQPAVPPDVAPRRSRRADHGLQQDQQVPRRPAAVPPRSPEGVAGRRQQPAREDAGRVGLADGGSRTSTTTAAAR